MEKISTILVDLVVVFFDLLLYTRLVHLRKNNWMYRAAMYVGCTVIIAAYYAASCIWDVPSSVAAALCMTVPSFFLFFALSRHRDMRMVLVFCLVDTVSLIVAFIGRYIGIVFDYGNGLAALVIVALYAVILWFGRKFLRQFYEILETVNSGWGNMAMCTVLVYFAMIFFAAYPKPIVQRMEYALSWFVLAAMVLSVYSVFLQSVLKTRIINEQNERLEKEKLYYRMAFTDALTGLYNRAAFAEKSNQLQRERGKDQNVCCIIIDLNYFKKINDMLGHRAGDEALIKTSEILEKVFSCDTQSVYRVGGDEFVVLLEDASREKVERDLQLAGRMMEEAGREFEGLLSMACGWDFLRSEKDTMEKVYERADRKMYEDKRRIKKLEN